MAEFEHVLKSIGDGQGGFCRIIAICESTQTELDPESGQQSPLVVRVRLQNTTAKSGLGRWVHSNGAVVTGEILPGENNEINIAANRRLALYRFPHGMAWGS